MAERRDASPRLLHRSDLLPAEAVGAVGTGVALLLMRPGLLGEQASIPGLALAWASGALCILPRGVRVARAGLVLLLLLVLSSCWFAVSGGGDGVGSVASLGSDLLLFISPVAVAVLAFGRPSVARALLVVVVIASAFLGASSAVSSVLTFAGVRVELLSFVIKEPVEAFVLAPFTPVAGVLGVLGESMPRFTGVGREPGWMAMLSAFCFFAAPVLGQRGARLVRPALLLGVLTPISTAGFGIFVVVLAAEALLDVGTIRNPQLRWLAVLVAVVALPVAAWLAVDAPVLGLGAKSDLNAASLAERSRATAIGFEALQHLSLGRETSRGASSINLVAAVATNGWPFLLLVTAAVAVPAALAANRALALPCAMVVLLTLLTAQPTPGSTGVFVLLVALVGLPQVAPPRLAGVAEQRPTGGHSVVRSRG